MIIFVKRVNAEIPLYLWESFIAVIEEKTLQKAALRLKTTQPTITRHLHQLEESLPLQLFELRGRIKEPTPFAEEIYRKINRRLKSLPEDIQSATSTYSDDEESLTVLVGGAKEHLISLSSLPFKGRLKFETAEEATFENLLKEARATFAIGESGVCASQYLEKKVATDDFVFAVPKKFARSMNATEWKKKAATHPLAVHTKARQIFRGYDHGHISFEAEDWHMLEARVDAGICWSILPKRQVRKNAQYIIFELPKKPGARNELSAYMRKDLAKRPWAKNFLSQIIETFR